MRFLHQREIDSTLPEIEKLADAPNFSVVIGKYISQRKTKMLDDIVAVVEKNLNATGSIIELGKILQGFYQSGEHHQLFTVWLAGTKPEHRREVMEFLACLLLIERYITELMKKQEEAKKKQ